MEDCVGYRDEVMKGDCVLKRMEEKKREENLGRSRSFYPLQPQSKANLPQAVKATCPDSNTQNKK